MEFTALGNSSSFEITKTKSSVKILSRSGDNTAEQKVKKTTNSKDWDQLVQLISNLEIDKMDSWKAPSQAFLYDGARATVIMIKTSDGDYNSLPFDEGNPPAELNNLYSALEDIMNSLLGS